MESVNTSFSSGRLALCRWVGWFTAASGLLFFLILSHYLFLMPHFHDLPYFNTRGHVLAWVFMLVSLLVQAGWFALISGVPAFCVAFLFGYRCLTLLLGVFFSAAMALFLVIDGFVYHLYHYHLLGVVWQIVRAGVAFQVLELSWVEWVFVGCIAVFFVFLLWFLSAFVARRVQSGVLRGHGQSVAYFFLGCLLLSYALSIGTSRNLMNNNVGRSNNHAIVMEAQIIPYYNEMMAFFLPHYSALNLETRDFGYFQQNAQVTKPLNYPLHPLQCEVPRKPLNIVFIVLDAWRFDRLNAVDSPRLYDLAKQSWVFKQHYSGGNATKPGIFSLFYSMPEHYWSAMLSGQQGPVFIHQLLKSGYQMGIFRSASLRYPAFDQTVFREVKPLQLETPGEQSFDRDRQITKEFKSFINKRDTKKPFFSFVFYDESHNYCESSGAYAQPFQPAVKVCSRMLLDGKSDPVPYLNRYRNAVHFDDQLAGEVIETLKQKKLLDNTIVVVTADHGEEFNESGLNYWGHASDYTKWQVHTPLVIYWPGERHQSFDYLTTHYDVVPLLMQKALGCQNLILDYSVGQPIREAGKRSFFVVNSYIDYAILQQDRITRIYSAGNYAITDRSGKPIPHASLNVLDLEKAWKQFKLYFK